MFAAEHQKNLPKWNRPGLAAQSQITQDGQSLAKGFYR